MQRTIIKTHYGDKSCILQVVWTMSKQLDSHQNKYFRQQIITKLLRDLVLDLGGKLKSWFQICRFRTF